jgi:predicted small integral membrane protein
MNMARVAKVSLLAAIALFFTLVVFNNLTDFDSNFQFVRHVMMMDTTFANNRGMWRAVQAPWLHVTFYAGIIAWETFNAVLCWWGAFSLYRALRLPVTEFQRAKRLGIAALTAGMLLWFVAFLSVGAEYFLMWQSKTWNGQEAAFRMFACESLVLILLMMAEPESSMGS